MMSNEELKKKIIEILEETECEWTEEKNGYILQIFYDKLADALIAAGIGDVSEYKHRAKVAEHELERRLAEATKAMYVYERALYYATLNGETADEVKYNDALKRAQKDFAENKGD